MSEIIYLIDESGANTGTAVAETATASQNLADLDSLRVGRGQIQVEVV
jgi:hypothetical protein